MPQPLVECVPNFSEGRDMAVIGLITDAVEAVDGVALLDVDPGQATNRTVVTFVGSPNAVVEAAVAAGTTAAELIDMSKHSGEHPRFGAMDVCPLVPISGITMEETAALAREAGRRLGEAGITVYLYENAASSESRRNLAWVRGGEYEGLERKLADAEWQPDFGPAAFNARSGATAVGARDFLVAYNVNLNTTSTRRANAIAFDVRERGRIKRIGDPLTGEVEKGADGEPVWTPGSLPSVKAIGWFIEEYGVAQISMNLTNISATPIHVAFDEVVDKADARGVRVTGSEIVGLVPLQAILDAGKHYLRKQRRSLGVSDDEIIKIAVKSMGLDELGPFKSEEKIIERMRDNSEPRLVDQTVTGMVHETASESPAPGGGSLSALAGALGAALGTMVANLSSHKRGWDDRWEEFSVWAEKGKELHDRLLRYVDEDTNAFKAILNAWRLPSGSVEETAARDEAIQAATRQAIEVPLSVMEASVAALEVAEAMARKGLESSASDAGVGALLAAAAVRGAHLNVRINVGDLSDESAKGEFLQRATALAEQAQTAELSALTLVEKHLSDGN